MNAIDALTEFKSFLESKEKSTEQLTPNEATNLMIDFYSTFRAENCEIDEDGDMLLFQWGIYDWGSGKNFEYNITRQFIFPMKFEEDDDEWEENTIWQLSLTLKYQPSEKFQNLKGNRWCYTPDDIPEFKKFIDSNEATKQTSTEETSVIELNFEQQ